MLNTKINDKAVAFVADWRKRAEEQQKKYMLMIIGSYVVAFTACILAFFWFQSKNYDRIVNQNRNYIEDSAIQEANQVERELKNAETLVMNFANQYANLVKYTGDTTVEDKLRLLGDKNLFDRLAFIDTTGTDISLEGTTQVGDRGYYQRGMQGQTGWELIQESRVTGRPAVIFYAPVKVDAEIIGVMAGFYEQDRLDRMFSYQFFNYAPNTYLLMEDGMVVANSRDERVTKNMLEELSKKAFVGEIGYADIQEAIEDETRTTINFSFIDNYQTSVGVIVQFSEGNWMILSVLPHTITAGMVSKANRIGTILMMIIVAAFLLLTFVVLYFLCKEKGRLEYEMTNASASLEETVKEEMVQFAIIESLGELYSSIYYIDMEKNGYRRVKELEKSSMAIQDVGNAVEGLSFYIKGFVHESYQEMMKEFLDVDTFARRIAQEGMESVEYQRKDESWRRATIAPAGRDENGIVTSVVFAVQKIDLEKQKELQTKKALQEAYEAAQLASNAKTTFLSNMSHDIRTPMNAIVGMTAIAAANIDHADKVADCLNTIASSSKHLLGLINNVLDMSKIETGKIDLCEEEFTLPELIDNLISINQALIKEKNHTLLVKINNVRHERVVGDKTRLQQVFTNLLSNAIKYTPDNGKLEICVSEKETNKPTIGWYEIVFKDNGIGMSEEFQKTLFEPFSRATDNRIAGIQGTGLGMSIARNIIKMMNGDITVQSKIDAGTTFTVSFALKLQTEEEIDYASFINLPILVVDDDIIACESTCTILSSLQMSSEWVTSGREAVTKTVEHHENKDDYYAVIIDWQMPDMNGVETAREIRRCVGEDVPIIIISAYDWADIEKEAREAGVNAFLSKPLFKSRVVDLFSELVGKKQKDTSSIKERIQKNDFSGNRILLVEDNEINREIAVEILAMVGLETESAENGKVGVEMLERSEPGYYQLVFMDIQMPVMNGYDSAKAMRALAHKDAKTIPIIAMTANAFASDVQAAMSAGMNGHISKPIDIDQLMKILNEYIK